MLTIYPIVRGVKTFAQCAKRGGSPLQYRVFKVLGLVRLGIAYGLLTRLWSFNHSRLFIPFSTLRPLAGSLSLIATCLVRGSTILGRLLSTRMQGFSYRLLPFIFEWLLVVQASIWVVSRISLIARGWFGINAEFKFDTPLLCSYEFTAIRAQSSRYVTDAVLSRTLTSLPLSQLMIVATFFGFGPSASWIYRTILMSDTGWHGSDMTFEGR